MADDFTNRIDRIVEDQRKGDPLDLTHDMEVKTPINVAASPVGAQATSGVAMVLLLVSALPAITAVLGTRDVTKIVAYIGSTEFAPVLGLLVAGGTILWRQLRVRWSHQEKVALADDASIGRVTS